MKSMTGFGQSEQTDERASISVELKSVNHRYKDFNLKISRKLSALEENIRKEISGVIQRGHIDVSIRFTPCKNLAIAVKYSSDAAKMYMSAISALKEEFSDLCDNFGVKELASMPEVIKIEEEADDTQAYWEITLPVLKDALAALERSRIEEGTRLKADFIKRIELVRGLISEIKKLAPGLPLTYFEQMKKRLSEFELGSLDEQRLLTELALYSDRVSITEELVRLESHLKSFSEIIESDEAVGRKLDFLFQEINREANTIASKSSSFEVSSLVVQIKSELEKMREQIQNIE